MARTALFPPAAGPEPPAPGPGRAETGAVAGRDPPSPTVAADWPHRARPGPELRPPEMEALRGGGRAGSAPERAKGGADVQRRGFRARRPLAAGRGERTLSSLTACVRCWQSVLESVSVAVRLPVFLYKTVSADPRRSSLHMVQNPTPLTHSRTR